MLWQSPSGIGGLLCDFMRTRLKKYLPQMQVEVFQGFGHGQFLNQHPEEYAQKLKDFMK
jgi:hypothetical protein